MITSVDNIPVEKKRRVWEVDFLRGFCMLFVVWDHLMFDLGFLCDDQFVTEAGLAISKFARDYWFSAIRTDTHFYFVAVFVLVSGVSVMFSKNSIAKAAKVGLFALLLTIATNAVDSVMGGGIAINFGILHMLAVCGLIWWFVSLFKPDSLALFVISVSCLVIGYFFVANPPFHVEGIWKVFIQSNSGNLFSPADFFPILPWLGYFFAGGLVGKWFYKNKQTLVPCVREKWVSPVLFVGRHSMWFYIAGQVVCIALVYALTGFGWL